MPGGPTIPLLDHARMKQLGMEILAPVERAILYSANEVVNATLRTIEVPLPISREDGIGIYITRWESMYSAPRMNELAADTQGAAQAWVHYGSATPLGLSFNSSRILGLRDERFDFKFDTAVGHTAIQFDEYKHVPMGQVVVTTSIFISTLGNAGWAPSGGLLSHNGRLWYYPVRLEVGAFVNAFAISQLSG